jgi:serine/threonine protein kinase
MGTVYSAIQEVTRRKVAIKIITEPGGNTSVSADRTARAMREARVLAKLSHPSIVSVLEVLMVRQLPALVMEHVAGAPLDEWIQSNRPDPIKAARIAIRVAEAIEHAHERGVLHCDLKPQNILVAVDDTGGGANAPAVKLIDFGLAKLWRDDFKITHPGDILGSPAYMAPEQASGGGDEPTHAIDIYGIGSVLYELLTGRPPFIASDRAALLAELLRHPPTPPSKVAEAIPRDLETVCLKCLEKNPSDRYPSARALASDLVAVVRNEPICAKRPSTWDRLRKWSQRNRALCGSLVGLVALATLGASIAAYQHNTTQSLANRLIVESTLKAQASVRAQQAEDALVDELRIGLQEMSKQAFSNSPQENSQQRVALQGIANRWQVFAKRTGDSTKSRAIRAEAHLRLGTIHSMLGEQDTAKNELQEAEQLLIQLIPTDPNSVYRNLLAETYGQLAKGAHQQGDIEGAIGYFRSALASLDSEPAPTRSIDWKRIELETDLRINFGTLLTLSKQFEPATEQLDLAKELLERAEVLADSQEDLLVQKCRTVIRIALNLQALGKIHEAIQTLERSSQEISQLNRLLQNSGPALDAYAMHQTVLGKCYRDVGNFELAKEHMTSAISAQRRLVAAAPSAPLLKSQLGINLGVLGVIESQRREMQPAIDATSESLAIHRKLLESHPDNTAYRYEEVLALTNLVAIHTGFDSLSEANQFAPRLLDARRELCKRDPDRIEFIHGLAVALGVVGSLQTKTNQSDEAQALFEEAEGLYRGLIDRLPSSNDYRNGLAKMNLNRAELARQKERWEQSVELYQQAIAIFEKGNAKSRQPERGWLKQCYLGQASAYEAMGDQQAMQRCLGLANSLNS